MKAHSSLFEIQKLLMSSIRGTAAPELAHLILEKPPISTSRRLGIYQEGFRIRRIHSLLDDFPSVEEKIGKEAFRELALRYIQQHPSTFSNLAEASQDFPAFLKNQDPALYSLAALDWLEILARTAKGLPPDQRVTAEEIQAGVDFRLVLNPTLEKFQAEDKCTLAWRTLTPNDGSVQLRTIEPRQLEILNQFHKSLSLDALANSTTAEESSLLELQRLLTDWVKAELLLCQRVQDSL